jgi:hypothetical protein
MSQNSNSQKGKKRIFTRYITKNGKRIYHPKGGVYVFWIDIDSSK